jgi:hypothetical protein
MLEGLATPASSRRTNSENFEVAAVFVVAVL